MSDHGLCSAFNHGTSGNNFTKPGLSTNHEHEWIITILT